VRVVEVDDYVFSHPSLESPWRRSSAGQGRGIIILLSGVQIPALRQGSSSFFLTRFSIVEFLLCDYHKVHCLRMERGRCRHLPLTISVIREQEMMTADDFPEGIG